MAFSMSVLRISFWMRVSFPNDTVAELAGKGIACEPVRVDTFTGRKMTFFHDPDGLPIEIHE